MPKKNIDLTYISDGTEREAAFQLMKEELMEKLYELQVLCDIDACAVIYIQSNSNPDVWPSNSVVKNILEKFDMLTDKEKTCRSVSHEEFLTQEIQKAKKNNQELSEKNEETFMRELMFGCLSGNMGDLCLNDNDRHDLSKFIDLYVKNLLHHKNLVLNNPHFEIGQPSSTAPTDMGKAGSSSSIKPSTLNSSDNSVASVPQTSSNQEEYIPVMDQVDIYNLSQNKNLEQRFVEEMIKIGEQTVFPWMEDNHHF